MPNYNSALAGGIVGYFNGGSFSITDCVNFGNIYSSNATFNMAAGMAGSCYGTIKSCANFGDCLAVGQWLYPAGMAGQLVYSGVIKNCYNAGNMTGIGNLSGSSVSAGGMAGQIAQTGQISNSYNIGRIYAETNEDGSYVSAGGIAGEFRTNTGYNTQIVNCFSVPDVAPVAFGCTQAYVGRIVGYECQGDNFVVSCFFSEGEQNEFGVKVENLKELVKNISNFQEGGAIEWTFDDANYGWNVGDVWMFSADINNGLPYLSVLSSYFPTPSVIHIMTNIEAVIYITRDNQIINQIFVDGNYDLSMMLEEGNYRISINTMGNSTIKYNNVNILSFIDINITNGYEADITISKVVTESNLITNNKIII